MKTEILNGPERRRRWSTPEASRTRPFSFRIPQQNAIVHAELWLSGVCRIKAHIEVAKKEGATKEDLLEVLEILVLMCGAPKFMMGYEAWKECLEVQRVEVD